MPTGISGPTVDDGSGNLSTRVASQLKNANSTTALLPDSAASADATANPTTSIIGAFNSVFNGTTWDRLRSATADALAATGLLGAGSMLWNGASWDRQRGCVDLTILASAARTTTQTVAVTNYNARGILIYWNITANPGAQTLTMKVDAIDPVSGVALTLLTSAAQGGNVSTDLFLYPGIAAVANIQSGVPIPRIINIVVTPSAGGSWTYSVGATLIP